MYHYHCTIKALLLTLLTADAFLLGGAVREIRSEPRSGDLLASSLAGEGIEKRLEMGQKEWKKRPSPAY